MRASALVQAWARTPLWKRAEYLHKVDGLMKDNAQPMADALLNEVYISAPGPILDTCMRFLVACWQCPAADNSVHLQVAKGAKDSLTEVIRSGDLIAYTAEEGVRYLGEVCMDTSTSASCRMRSLLLIIQSQA